MSETDNTFAIGRRFPVKLEIPSLKIGRIMDCFNSCGNKPSDKDVIITKELLFVTKEPAQGVKYWRRHDRVVTGCNNMSHVVK